MLFILGMAVLIYIITIGYISYNLRQSSISEAKKLADTYASQKANDIKASLNEDIAIARSMADIVKDYTLLPKGQRDSLRKDLMVSILKNNPRYDATFMSWELSAIDPEWTLSYGRERQNFYIRNGKVQSSSEIANTEGDDPESVYLRIKNSMTEEMSEPYTWADYDYSNTSADSILGTSPVAPILLDGKFIGVIGSDLTLKDFEGMSEVDFTERGFAFLISNGGVIIAHKNPDFFNMSIDNLSFTKSVNIDVKAKIKNGETFSYTVFDEEFGEEVYVSFSPILLGRSGKSWSAGTIIPISEITSSFNKTFKMSLLVGIIGLAFLTLVIWKIATPITVSIEDTNELLKDIAEGNLNSEKRLAVNSTDELGEMAISVNILVDELNKKAQFSRSPK